MSETLPRPIEPGDIRVGDRVRMEQRREGDVLTADFTVTWVTEGMAGSEGAGVWDVNHKRSSWTLLARTPEPERPVGSHWRDPETGAEYVRRSDGDYSRYRTGGCHAGDPCLVQGLDDEIARLTPVPPAFDPAALWPPAKLNDDWCAVADKNSGYGCSRPAGHDGWVHAAYEAHGDRQELGPLLAVWGDLR